jgi:diguanylate cyclase (GGDEF)-like protein/PAS domain S-box-containing protein
MIPINLAFIAANGLGVWSLDLLTQERTMGDPIFAFDNLHGASLSLATMAWNHYLHPEDRRRGDSKVKILLRDGKQIEVDFRVTRASGELIHIQSMIKVFRDDDGKPIRIQGASIDITEFKLSEEKLRLASSVFTHTSEAIAITEPAGNIVEVNDAFTAITGYCREEVLGKNLRILKSDRHSPAFYAEIWRTLADKEQWRGEICNRRKSGELYIELLSISLVRDASGVITHYLALFTDISQLKEQQKELEKLVYFDYLTHLPNRPLLTEFLSLAKRQSLRNQQSLAVLFIDLDGFKAVNDKYGHDVGDELLIALSERMKGALRESDTLARFGGDEFVAVLTGLENHNSCKSTLDRLLRVTSDTVKVGNIKLKVSASIGVTFYPQDNSDSDLLIRHADQSMYKAKKAGKSCYQFFNSVVDIEEDTQRENIQRMHIALQQDEFVLYYQPKVNIDKGTVVGVEALIRWQHPELGLLSPIEFLPLIENHPFSIELGEWVIATALRQISAWQAQGLDIAVSVNICALQLQQNGFAKRLQTLLSEWPQVAPRYLLIEVLETIALSDVMQVSTIMKDCIELGVRFALDDFGTGYSSLTHLRHLPAELIKIDTSFVRDMLINPDDLMIVESVVSLAKSFKREVIAEGVETIAHGATLLRLGCVLMQGYGIARPMPARNISPWVKKWSSETDWAANNLLNKQHVNLTGLTFA